ncbi:RNHCP domain-containing protein [Clostridiaceae bacterium M8S5]|nr:RNHCP domain-containing protein [Clostridiaceae bacterium M8S5]
MSRKNENQGFICQNCGATVNALKNGSYRNHCPYCLYSLHVDIKPGDRNNSCMSVMKPIGIKNTSNKGMQVIHQCIKCKEIRVNKVALDDEQPDDFDILLRLM